MGKVIQNCIMSERYSIKWDNFQNNVTESYRKFRDEADFFDVTLVSDDQKQISAHKVVLSACSQYFKNILKVNKHPNPLLCLEGISSQEINSVLDFAHHGEASIYQDDLERFLKVGGRFQLEGLITEGYNSVESLRQKKLIADENDSESVEYDLGTKVEVKEEEVNKTESKILADLEYESSISETSRINIKFDQISNIEELDAKIIEYIEKTNGARWKCTVCGKTMKDKTAAKEHVEVHFEGLAFSCEYCDKKLKSRKTLRSHTNRFHKKYI